MMDKRCILIGFPIFFNPDLILESFPSHSKSHHHHILQHKQKPDTIWRWKEYRINVWLSAFIAVSNVLSWEMEQSSHILYRLLSHFTLFSFHSIRTYSIITRNKFVITFSTDTKYIINTQLISFICLDVVSQDKLWLFPGIKKIKKKKIITILSVIRYDVWIMFSCLVFDVLYLFIISRSKSVIIMSSSVQVYAKLIRYDGNFKHLTYFYTP